MFPGRGKTYYDGGKRMEQTSFPKCWREIPFVPSEASTQYSPRRKEDQVSPRKDLLLTMFFWMTEDDKKTISGENPESIVSPQTLWCRLILVKDREER
ncbi:hypothetical protein CEXT_512901 [Caerostris extrusa]|uniref:Uncharacterized protein n=1 Tax=Caerostris extrusa TaxID=172846 RepID=A0AAV4XIP4_CAEEX|nr:hypothetical protein CEXT_512901 [Caerostris extrusa]